MMRILSARRRLGNRWSIPNSNPPCLALLRRGAVGLVLAMALAAAAQDGTQTPNGGRTGVSRAEFVFEIDSSVANDADKRRERETAEDMAVMGKLVDQSLAGLYASAGRCGDCHSVKTAWSAAFDHWSQLHVPSRDEAHRAFDAILGPRGRTMAGIPSPALFTYLEGYGVVYQLEAPSVDAEAAEQVKAKCPFLAHTPWERTVLQLKGQWKTEQCLKCHSTANGDKARGDANVIDQLVRRKLAMRYLYQGDWHTRDMTLLGIEPHHRSAWPPTRAKLVATLLDVLAENGHNFRHLAPEERVAVALTLRAGAEPSAALRQVWQWMFAPELPDASPDELKDNEARPEDAGSGDAAPPPGKESDAPAGDLLPQNPGGATSFGDFDADGDLDLLLSGPQGDRIFRNLGSGRFQSDGVSAFDVSAFDYNNDGDLDLYVNQGQPTTQELTGDLYMRQRKYAAAVASYEKALREAARSAPDAPKDAGARRRLYNKLIQALVAANRFDMAKKLLDVLGGNVKPAGAPDQARETAKATAPRLPARLVVSATKAQLDALHGGALSREEFAKQVTVQYVDLNPGPGKAGKRDGRDSAKE
jgi:hypothetical protein